MSLEISRVRVFDGAFCFRLHLGFYVMQEPFDLDKPIKYQYMIHNAIVIPTGRFLHTLT